MGKIKVGIYIDEELKNTFNEFLWLKGGRKIPFSRGVELAIQHYMENSKWRGYAHTQTEQTYIGSKTRNKFDRLVDYLEKVAYPLDPPTDRDIWQAIIELKIARSGVPDWRTFWRYRDLLHDQGIIVPDCRTSDRLLMRTPSGKPRYHQVVAYRWGPYSGRKGGP